MNYVAQVLLSNESRITQDLGSTPSGYILVSGLHLHSRASVLHLLIMLSVERTSTPQRATPKNITP